MFTQGETNNNALCVVYVSPSPSPLFWDSFPSGPGADIWSHSLSSEKQKIGFSFHSESCIVSFCIIRSLHVFLPEVTDFLLWEPLLKHIEFLPIKLASGNRVFPCQMSINGPRASR